MVDGQDRDLGRIVAGMDVYDMSGKKLGTLAHVYRDEQPSGLTDPSASAQDAEGRSGVLEVKTGVLGLGKPLYPPLDAVHDTTEAAVFLSESKDHLPGEWRHKPDSLEGMH